MPRSLTRFATISPTVILAPATVHAYLSDLARFQAWLTWVHEDQAPHRSKSAPWT